MRSTCAHSRSTARCRISVADHGPGIPYDQQRLIFEKFGRAEITGGSKPGTGLGLFIARSIAEAHGGTIDVRSSPDAGSTFTLDVAGRLDAGRAKSLDAELLRQRSCALGNARAQICGLEDDRLAAFREDLALEPLVAADGDLAQC